MQYRAIATALLPRCKNRCPAAMLPPMLPPLPSPLMTATRVMAMATVTKRAMVTDDDNTGNGDGKEGDK